MLRRLAWSSVPSPSFSAAHINQIIVPSRRNNLRDHISGMQLFTGAHFVAILEGGERELGDLWSRLEQDQRHRDLFRIGDDWCGSRLYAEWRTAYLADPKVDATIEALRSLQSDVDAAHPSHLRAPKGGLRQTSSAPMWSRIIGPIMSRADSM